MSFIDDYTIKDSESFESEGRQETFINLELEENPNKKTGTVKGTVVDSNGDGIANATVKLCTSTLTPFEHLSANSQGKFVFSTVPVGAYYIAAIADGYLMPDAISIAVAKSKTTEIEITLITDEDSEKNIVYGIIRDGGSNEPLGEAIVYLYEKEGTEDVFVGVVTTNSYGQYYFVDLDDGDYYVQGSKAGYLSTQSNDVDISDKDYVALDVSLTSDPTSDTGVVCGNITDEETERPISGAQVALYAISGSTETLIQLTKTNTDGKYLFGNISQGEYRIKATKQVEVS
jgi:hypothetical protein